MEKETFDTEYLESKGFTLGQFEYYYKKGQFGVIFTPAGCAFMKNNKPVYKFDGYIDDLKKVWLKETVEHL